MKNETVSEPQASLHDFVYTSIFLYFTPITIFVNQNYL